MMMKHNSENELKNNNENEMIINKCLIIDDKFDEVKDIIFNLNKHSISTDYREDVLDKDVQIDPNTQLVILDLYMSEDQNSFDNALNSVAFLNENIKGPFFLLVWTKHIDQYDNFIKTITNDYSIGFSNFPLQISNLETTKSSNTQLEETVNQIENFIKNIKNNYPNIYNYLLITKIFQKQSTMFWELFTDDELTQKKKESKDFSKYYNNILGQAFSSFDNSFNYEKSGKGFLNIHTKFLEHTLTENTIEYTCEDGKLNENFTNEINSRLLLHHFDKDPKKGLPGLIYKYYSSEEDHIISETKNMFISTEKYSEHKEKIELGKLVITPYCDFAQNKKKEILYLPIIIIEHEFNRRSKLFKKNIYYLNLYNGRYIAYNPSMYNVCKLDELAEDKYQFYISKEYVNEIQINIANNISRIGTTIIE